MTGIETEYFTLAVTKSQATVQLGKNGWGVQTRARTVLDSRGIIGNGLICKTSA
jgi:hypothetical protein